MLPIVSGGTSICWGYFSERTLWALARRFSKMSAIAIIFTGPLGESNALAAAPLLRPPQPMSARRMVLFSAAWTKGSVVPASAEAAASLPLRDTNSRREREVEGAWDVPDRLLCDSLFIGVTFRC